MGKETEGHLDACIGKAALGKLLGALHEQHDLVLLQELFYSLFELRLHARHLSRRTFVYEIALILG